MKKIGLVLLLLVLANSCSKEIAPNDNSKEVYICTGKYSHSYHRSKTCNGLNNCSGEIKKISLEDAERAYDKCKICY